MIRYENDCVDCPIEKGCLRDACPYRHVKHFYCDVCGEDCDPDDLYLVDDTLVCKDCLTDYLLDEGIIERINEDYGD